ncbi:MAG: universal stress protein [Rhizobacter sp.]|nr:universal stress protein [Rhizobacter sp.]
MKILLAVDGSTFTKRMLAYIAAHDELIGASNQITVITAVTPVPPHVTSFINNASLQQYYSDEAEAVLKPVRAFAEQNKWKPTFTTAVGNAAEVIAKAANDGKFDMVIMGSHGHSALGSLVMGSVTSRVMAHCTAPVLIVR